jgi:phenylalanine-4-hydroxylase
MPLCLRTETLLVISAGVESMVRLSIENKRDWRTHTINPDFSQEIGLASLGASDEDIVKLARCYWFSVEFGVCKENGVNKAYGAGLLSSFGELEYACGDNHPGADEPPNFLPWNPEVASKTNFPITTFQPTYFMAESVQDAKDRMRAFCEDLPRPFFALLNPQTSTVHIDRPVRRSKGIPGAADL